MVDFVRGVGRATVAGFTRPANTTAYSAGQVIADSTSTATLRKFQGTKDQAGFAILARATLVISANQATLPDLQLWIFNSSGVTVANDAASFAPSFADMKSLVAVISFPQSAMVVANSAAGASGNVTCDAQGLWLPVNTVSGDNALYGVLVVRNAYTPTSGEQYQITLEMVD